MKVEEAAVRSKVNQSGGILPKAVSPSGNDGKAVRKEGGDTGIEAVLGELQSKFPEVDLYVGDFVSTEDIRRYAQSHYGTMQVVLSPDVLKKMAADPEFKKQCEKKIADARKAVYEKTGQLRLLGKQVLGSGVVLDEDGNTAQWVVSKEEKRFTDGFTFPTTSKNKDSSISRFQNTEGHKFVIKKKLDYRPSKDLSRLARACDEGMVRSTISGIRASIYQLKTAGREQRKVASQLIGQAEQVLMKARIKIKKLKEEDLLRSAGEKAQERAQIKKAEYIKRLIAEKQVKRRVREYTQIRDYYPTPQEIKREEDAAKRWVESSMGDSGLGTTVTFGSQTYSPNGFTTDGGANVTPGVGVFVDITL